MPGGDPFTPNPWLMGLVLIGAGVVLWWLTPDAVRRDEEFSRWMWGRWSLYRRWPEAMRRMEWRSHRLGAVCAAGSGVVLLLHTALT